MDESAPTSKHPKGGQTEEAASDDGPTPEVSHEELRELRNSPVLKVTGFLMLLNIPLALWVLLGSLGLVPFDMLVFWGWLALMAIIALLQMHPTIRRARKVSQQLRQQQS